MTTRKPYKIEHITIKIIDVTADLLEQYGGDRAKAEYIAGRPIPDVDLRYEVTADDGEGNVSQTTMHTGAHLTAEQLLAHVNWGRG